MRCRPSQPRPNAEVRGRSSAPKACGVSWASAPRLRRRAAAPLRAVPASCSPRRSGAATIAGGVPAGATPGRTTGRPRIPGTPLSATVGTSGSEAECAAGWTPPAPAAGRCLHVRQHGRRTSEGGVHLAGDQVRHRRRGAAVRDVQHEDTPGRQLQQIRSRDVRGAAVAARRVGELGRDCALERMLDEVLETARRTRPLPFTTSTFGTRATQATGVKLFNGS